MRSELYPSLLKRSCMVLIGLTTSSWRHQIASYTICNFPITARPKPLRIPRLGFLKIYSFDLLDTGLLTLPFSFTITARFNLTYSVFLSFFLSLFLSLSLAHILHIFNSHKSNRNPESLDPVQCWCSRRHFESPLLARSVGSCCTELRQLSAFVLKHV
jgi:hypothetical protein